MPGPGTPQGLPANAHMAGLEVSLSHLIARDAADALLTNLTTPVLSPVDEIVWAGGATGLVRLPAQSGIVLPRTAGGFGARLYLRTLAGAVNVTITVAMRISVGSIGVLTPPVFTPTVFTRNITVGGQYNVDKDDSDADIIEQLPSAQPNGASMMTLHGVEVNVTANDTDVTLFGVGLRAV